MALKNDRSKNTHHLLPSPTSLCNMPATATQPPIHISSTGGSCVLLVPACVKRPRIAALATMHSASLVLPH